MILQTRLVISSITRSGRKKRTNFLFFGLKTNTIPCDWAKGCNRFTNCFNSSMISIAAGWIITIVVVSQGTSSPVLQIKYRGQYERLPFLFLFCKQNCFAVKGQFKTSWDTCCVKNELNELIRKFTDSENGALIGFKMLWWRGV